MAETTDTSSSENSAAAVTFGRYELLERIGSGGMAEVFKARINAAAGTEKLVCIKRILPHLSRSGDFTSLFVSEARITLPLTHGNITQVFDFGEVDQTYYLAMEYVRGQNLARALEQLARAGERLDVAAALFVGAEVCRGLQYAHALTDADGNPAPVVHRDVSPHNVLISYHGEVKLTDFGIALAATKAPGGEQVLRGKPCYIAPEQTKGSSGDPRSDVFALGAVLYEMLSGMRVFEGASDAETLERVRTLEIAPPSEHNPQVEEDLDRVVLKALSRDPEARYQHAGELQVELSRLLHKRATAFTAGDLASWMKELFAWEIQAERGNGGPRDRLLFQLSRAGVQVEGGASSTDELLQMGTVAIGEGNHARSSASDAPRLWPWISVGVVLVLGALTGAVFTLRGGSAVVSVMHDAGVVAPPRSPSELTEHLLPRSLMQQEPDDGVEAAKVAHERPDAQGRQRTAPVIRLSAAARAAQMGYVNCNSWPWSFVYLDGKRLRGNTPLYRVEVRSGPHRLRFVNPELGLSRDVTVTVQASQTKTIAVKLQPSEAKQHDSNPTAVPQQ